MDYFEPSATEWEEDLREIRMRLLGAGAALIAVTLIGTVGFMLIDPSAGWIRAFFMTAITLTTVGYGQEIPLDTDAARIFTAVLILVGMGVLLYFVSTGTAFILEGQLGHVFRRKRMERDLDQLNSHVIVCGSGPSAVYAARELAAIDRPVVLIVSHADEVPGALQGIGEIPVVVGNPTDDETLIAAGIERAAGMVISTDTDNENVVVTLTARQVNPNIRIVSQVEDVDHEAKIRKVGADSVVSPYFIGGLRMASELIRPTVVSFLDAMLRDRDLNLRVDEMRIPEESPSVGKQFRDLGLDKMPGILLVATRSPTGEWRYNPSRAGTVAPGMVLIFLGSPEDSRQLCDQLGGEMLGAPLSR